MMISRRYLMTVQAILGVLVLTFGLLLVHGCSKAEHADDDYDDYDDYGDVSHDDEANHDDTGEVDDHDGDAHDHDHDDANGDAHHDDDDDHDHAQGGHGEPVEFSAPQTYVHAVEAIHAQLVKIESLMATGRLDRVHAEAAVIRDIANGIGRLALKDGSGVPREAVREINLTAKDLAAKFGPIDEAGDSGDLAGTQKVYDEMVALFETFEKYAPDHDHDDHDDH